MSDLVGRTGVSGLSVCFRRMKSETSVYFMSADSPLGLVLMITIVDDFLVLAKTQPIMKKVKDMLRTVWTISDKGPAKWMLNLRIIRDRPAGILKLEQSAYIEQKLREFGIDKLPGKNLPMRPKLTLSQSMCPTDSKGIEEAKKLPSYRSATHRRAKLPKVDSSRHVLHE